MSARPSGTCPACGRVIAGRMPVKGKLILRRHMKVLKGTKESGWGPGVPCPGRFADLLTAVPSDPS